MDTSDWEVYKEGSLNRGIGYSEERFKEIFANDFTIVEFRRMIKISQPATKFGEDFLWTSLMQIRK
ncbi:hypothetical protein [Metabacillus dongyingensis]|uniref:hypothetical protein n=1 Tax=Metabacillus dongyingensis TaxID=2874282 RepID=UPI00308409C4